MPWTQVYTPLGNLYLSAAVAALPDAFSVSVPSALLPAKKATVPLGAAVPLAGRPDRSSAKAVAAAWTAVRDVLATIGAPDAERARSEVVDRRRGRSRLGTVRPAPRCAPVPGHLRPRRR